MKPDKLSELLQDIDEALIARAGKRRGKNRALIIRTVALCACLALVITVTLCFALKKPDTFVPDGTENDSTGTTVPDVEGSTAPDNDALPDEGFDGSSKPGGNSGVLSDEGDDMDETDNKTSSNNFALSLASYPATVQRPGEETDDIEQFREWSDSLKHISSLPTTDKGIRDYVDALVGRLLKDDGDNKVISPANIYFSLAMLAQTSDGDTRAQILDLLGYGDIDSLRKNSNNLWQKLYVNDGISTSVLANSLWLSDKHNYNVKTVTDLSKYYFSSVYSGDVTSPAYSQALRDWVNEQTGGLLREQSKHLSLPADTVFSLVSTVYFRAKWMRPFLKNSTADAVFRGTDGNVTAPFMNASFVDYCYTADNFLAVSSALDVGDCKMHFILPDKDKSVNDVLRSKAFSDFVYDPQRIKSSQVKINLSLPKFDISYSEELSDDLKALGITDAFNDKASDFTPMCDDLPISLSKIDHAARVRIDEEGCEAAAYTVSILTNTGLPSKTVDMVFDRPFIFVITGAEGLPRFIGTVNNV